MTYVFKNLRELALFFKQRADHEDRTVDAQTTSRNKAYHQGERNAYLYAGEVVRDCVVEDVELYDEYRVAYAEAQVQLASTFWQLLKAGGVAVACYGVDKGWAAP